MQASTRLREVAGLPAEPAPLSQSVLVLIDCQNTYREGIMALEGVEPALKEAAALLERARAAGVPVIHIQHDAGPGSPYDIRESIGAIAGPVAPRAGEAVIVKNYPNSFVQTDLAQHIAATGRQDVVLAGFMTHMCVNSTARGAFNLGLRPTVIAAATATRNLPGTDGTVVPAAELQRASLAALADLFAIVLPGQGALGD